MKKTLRIAAALLLLAARFTSAETNAAGFAWGKEERGLQLGLRVERVGPATQDLYRFTVAVTNCSGGTNVLMMGNSWDGPVAPQLTFGEDREQVRIVQPPFVVHRGRGITHIAFPITLELKPGEARCIHHSLFVPPMPAGTWRVEAQYHPPTGRSQENVDRREIPNLRRGAFLGSGAASVTLTSEHPPPPEPPAVRRLMPDP